MNSDQLNSLIRTGLKILGSILLTHGLTNAANVVNSPDVLGAITLLAGIVWSHYAHASITPPSSTPPPAPSGSSKFPLMTALISTGLSAALFFGNGCATTPQQASYQAAGTTVVSVDAAMNLWGAYVAANHPPASQETAVKNAFEKYQASMAVLCDAGAAYSATGGTNAAASAAFSQAVANSSQELADLESLISSFGVKLQ